jgi:DNA-directed RNA polymerase specialized sigma24 family protein
MTPNWKHSRAAVLKALHEMGLSYREIAEQTDSDVTEVSRSIAAARTGERLRIAADARGTVMLQMAEAGMSTATIAKIVRVSVATVRERIRRARTATAGR